MLLYSMKFALQFQRNVSVTRLKLLIHAMKTTQQSCLESERLFLKILLEFNINSTKKSMTQC